MLYKNHPDFSVTRETRIYRRDCISTNRRYLPVFIATFYLTYLSMVAVIYADEIYKTVDADGNVSYTTEAPDSEQDTKVIKTLPEPSELDIAEARERQQSIEDDLKETQEAIRQPNNNSAQSQSSGSGGSTIIIQPYPTILAYPYYYRDGRRYSNHPHPGPRPHRPPSHKPGLRPPAHIQPAPFN
jgi:hypothetical protein